MLIYAHFYPAGIFKYIFVCDIKTKSFNYFLIKLYEIVSFSACELDMNEYMTYDLKNCYKNKNVEI